MMPNLFLQLSDDEHGSGATPSSVPLDRALQLLTTAEITASRLIPWGSNYSFAVALENDDGDELLAIYKPREGETPLYDFPEGSLYLREVASYVLSERLGWGLVPPTVVREGPHGIGSLQLYIHPAEDEQADPNGFWGRCAIEIERMVLFDHLANNADRKLGHCLRDTQNRVWGIDHGLTFNEFPKLRTVLWQFVGQPIDASLLADLARLLAEPTAIRADLAGLLNQNEIEALMSRAMLLFDLKSYPVLNPRRNIPYGWW